MYRVELKGPLLQRGSPLREGVPNVPCGVESAKEVFFHLLPFPVPNVPCGVERFKLLLDRTAFANVPNVPCGVERKFLQFLQFFHHCS